ncbi:MAG: hypothetical protein ACJ8GN_26265 [Longimicrobiaceae bacterium]
MTLTTPAGMYGRASPPMPASPPASWWIHLERFDNVEKVEIAR